MERQQAKVEGNLGNGSLSDIVTARALAFRQMGCGEQEVRFLCDVLSMVEVLAARHAAGLGERAAYVYDADDPTAAQLYLRVTDRILFDATRCHTLEIARVEFAPELRGHGRFKRLLAVIETVAALMERYVYVEAIMNSDIFNHLSSGGYEPSVHSDSLYRRPSLSDHPALAARADCLRPRIDVEAVQSEPRPKVTIQRVKFLGFKGGS